MKMNSLTTASTDGMPEAIASKTLGASIRLVSAPRHMLTAMPTPLLFMPLAG